MSKLLKFGMRDNELLSIDDVTSGLKCGCVCPACGSILIAKKGKINEHHFAHYKSEDCGVARESALHILAKKIICETKKVYIPPKVDGGGSGEIKVFRKAIPEACVFAGFIPDILLSGDNGQLAIEILVTHAVDEKKAKRIFFEKVDTIEIDLSNIIDEYDADSVAQALLQPENSTWIYNSTLEEATQIRTQKSIFDHLPITGNNYCYCPMLKRMVDFLFTELSCHECWYYAHDVNFDDWEIARPCSYRVRTLTKETILSYTNIKRENGLIVSIDVKTPEGWQHWQGGRNQLLSLNPNGSIKREHRACFTGHRPEKPNQQETKIARNLETIICDAYLDGINVFISGMAQGVDIMAAETILELRKKHEDIKLICAVPYKGFEDKWDSEWQQRYNAVLQTADLVKYISPSYSPTCFQMRNEWMINHSAMVIAVYNGSQGETQNTIDYARKNNVTVVVINC